MGMENRYDKYKDSGIVWIGEIPEHWEKICLKRLSNINTGNQDTQDSVPDGKYPFFVRSPKVEKSNKYTFEGASILMAGDGVGAGKVFHLADDKFACHQRVYCINQFKNINRIYLFYYLSSLFYHVIESANSKSTVDSVRLPMLAEFTVFMPLDFEQQSIATYLDQKCSEIDELITLQEEMITKLQSYKQSVITEAVTKGLDKNVPLKDSGIEWIGEIPEHWNVIKIKNTFKIVSGATPKTDNMTYWDGEITWITPADYKTEDRIIKSGKRNITLAGLNSCGTSIVPENSIIFSKRAPIGLVAINIIPLCTNQGCISCIPKSFVSSKYFYYLMSILTEWFELFGSGTTFKELSANNFANFSLSQPPLAEQQSIANYLDQKCSEIDELISIKQQKIEKLKDYKKSLIFECVTGKRKV